MAGPFVTSADVKAALAKKAAQPATAGTQGQVLTRDTASATGTSWVTPAAGGSGGSGTVPDATATTNGVVRLTGDLAGTAAAPTLKQVNATAKTYGSSTAVPQVTIDTAGRTTAVTEVAITVAAGNVSGLDSYVQAQAGEVARDAVAAMFAKGTSSGVALTFDDVNDSAAITVGGDGFDQAVARYLNTAGSAARSAAQALLGAGPALTATTYPAISGSTAQGQTLTTSLGTWNVSPDSYRYQWSRAGVAVAGQTSRSYVTTAADVGKTVTVTVTAVKVNYADGAATTPAVTVTAAPTAATSAALTRSGNRLQAGGVNVRVSGANVYWLGLNDNNGGGQYGTYPSHDTITTALQGVKDMGGNLVRAHTVGISAGTPRSFMTAPGTYSDANLDAADWAVKEAGRLGITLMTPLTDNWNYYHGGKWNFVHWAYQQNPSGLTDTPGTVKDDPNERVFFATTAAGLRVRALFKEYVTAWLNHVNPYTGLAYKDDPTIGIVETGNEIYYAAQGGADWTQDIAQTVKSIAPNKLVADGSAADRVAVSGNPAASIAAVDVLGAHYYPQQQSGSYPPVQFTDSSAGYPAGTALQQLAADAAAAKTAGKAFIVGEYPWTRSTVGQLYTAVESNADVAGDMYWAYIAGAETHGGAFGSDDYAVHRPYLTAQEQQYAPALAQHAAAVNGASLGGGAGATPVAATNLIASTAARNASDASILTAGNATLTTDTSQSKSGGSSVKVTPVGSGIYPYLYGSTPNQWAPVTPGTSYTAFASTRTTTSSNLGFQAVIVWFKADGTYIAGSAAGSYATAVQGQWVQCSVTAGAPAGAAYGVVQVQAGSAMSAGDVFNVDEYGLVAGTSTVWSA